MSSHERPHDGTAGGGATTGGGTGPGDGDGGDGGSLGRTGVGPRTEDPLARAIGVTSLGLGAALLAGPGAVVRLVGLRDSPGARLVAVAVGVREVVAGTGVLASRRPVGWLWARTAGDGFDVGLLALGAAVQARSHRPHLGPVAVARRGRPLLRRPRSAGPIRSWWGDGLASLAPPRRTVVAIGFVTVVAVVDLAAALRVTRRRGPHRTATVSITVNRPPDEVYRRWRELQDTPRFLSHLDLRPTGGRGRHRPPRVAGHGRPGWEAEVVNEVPGELIEWRSGIAAEVDHAGTVRFEPAPGGTGTVITIRVDYRPPGGLLGSLVAGFLGEHPRQQISDDLLRVKHALDRDDD